MKTDAPRMRTVSCEYLYSSSTHCVCKSTPISIDNRKHLPCPKIIVHSFLVCVCVYDLSQQKKSSKNVFSSCVHLTFQILKRLCYIVCNNMDAIFGNIVCVWWPMCVCVNKFTNIHYWLKFVHRFVRHLSLHVSYQNKICTFSTYFCVFKFAQVRLETGILHTLFPILIH